MLRRTLCQADVALELEPIDPILIKSGYATFDGPDMVPVRTFRDGKQTYYFPGSSLKGVLRSHLERIARTLVPGSVCIPYYDPRHNIPIPVESERQAYGCGFRRTSPNGKDSSAAAYRDSCAACRLFGSLKFGGRFSIGDAYPIDGQLPTLEQRNGVGIDRFTGGTVPGVLFDLQTLVGGRFQAAIRVLNFECWQLAALNILLLDLADEIMTIGSGRSRGLGRVRGHVTAYTLSYMSPMQNVAGLYELASDGERQAYGLHASQPAVSIALPPGQARGLRTRYDLTADWPTRLQLLTPTFAAFLEWHEGPKGQVTGETDANAGTRS